MVLLEYIKGKPYDSSLRNRRAYIEDVGGKCHNTVYRHHEQEPDDVWEGKRVSVRHFRASEDHAHR